MDNNCDQVAIGILDGGGHGYDGATVFVHLFGVESDQVGGLDWIFIKDGPAIANYPSISTVVAYDIAVTLVMREAGKTIFVLQMGLHHNGIKVILGTKALVGIFDDVIQLVQCIDGILGVIFMAIGVGGGITAVGGTVGVSISTGTAKCSFSAGALYALGFFLFPVRPFVLLLPFHEVACNCGFVNWLALSMALHCLPV